MEIEMRKTVITILGASLITLSATSMAAASERHARRAYDHWGYRGSYNQLSGPSYAIPETRAGRNIENFGFSGRDPSRVGGWDPNLNPSGS
jgi:hypothetical protein